MRRLDTRGPRARSSAWPTIRSRRDARRCARGSCSTPRRGATNGASPSAPGSRPPRSCSGAGATRRSAWKGSPTARAAAGRAPLGAVAGADGRRAATTLEHLLEAAARTIARRGFAATRVADIAREAGVSPATVHYHFKVKEEILVARAAVGARAADQRSSSARIATDRRPGRAAGAAHRAHDPLPGRRSATSTCSRSTSGARCASTASCCPPGSSTTSAGRPTSPRSIEARHRLRRLHEHRGGCRARRAARGDDRRARGPDGDRLGAHAARARSRARAAFHGRVARPRRHTTGTGRPAVDGTGASAMSTPSRHGWVEMPDELMAQVDVPETGAAGVISPRADPSVGDLRARHRVLAYVPPQELRLAHVRPELGADGGCGGAEDRGDETLAGRREPTRAAGRREQVALRVAAGDAPAGCGRRPRRGCPA